MSGGGYSKDVKIVIISTQYVETDVMNFKSLVQKLTGKDSDTDVRTDRKASGSKTQKEKNQDQAGFEVPAGSGENSFLIRDTSFKKFDRFLGGMPPIVELCSD